MRNQEKLALLIVATFLVACSGKVEKQTAAVTSPAAANLDVAPHTYTRMSFVSEVEQSKSRIAMKARSHATRSAKAHIARAADPIASMAMHQLTVGTTREAIPEQSAPIVMASMPAPRVEARVASPADSYIDHSAEGDGLLAGVTTRVVIRGGMVGDHKCDPRSEAQARGELAGRPNASMPLMPKSTVFGGGRR